MTWFRKKIKDNSCCFLILKYQNQKAGTVRIEIKENENIVGITVAPEFRGKKLAPLFLQKASDYFFKKHPGTNITAYIKIENTPSIKSFEKAGYIFKEEGNFFGSKSLKLIKTNEQL
ncbi:MAG: hypothetical protein JWO32_1889 [Bacteroidetes bacterium]|nr:hypothetical protein [Bacteroidota bacterium]